MKIFSVILSVLSSILVGQAGLPYINVDEDTVEFGITDMLRNCAVLYTMSVEQNDSVFTVIATDTSEVEAFCDCVFDVSINIQGILPGTYNTHFYSYDLSIWDDSLNTFTYDTVYIGELSFTILDSTENSFSVLSSYQSPCGGTQSIKDDILPKNHVLVNNYPNPFNSSTQLNLYIPTNTNIDVSVFNIKGHKVATIVSDYYISGNYSFNWNAFQNSSGIYLITVITENESVTRKMLLIK